MWSLFFMALAFAGVFAAGAIVGHILARKEYEGRAIHWRRFPKNKPFKPLARKNLSVNEGIVFVIVRSEDFDDSLSAEGPVEFFLIKFDQNQGDRVADFTGSSDMWIEGKPGSEKINSYNWPFHQQKEEEEIQ